MRLHSKKYLVILCLLCIYCLFGINFVYASGNFAGLNLGDNLGKAITSDIIAKINGQVIPSLNIQGQVVVLVADLNNYGFDVTWDNKSGTLEIERNINKSVSPVLSNLSKGDIIYSNIKAYIGNQQLLTYNIDGQAAICLNELAWFGKVYWDDKNKELSVLLDNNYSDEVLPMKIRNDYFILNSFAEFTGNISFMDVYTYINDDNIHQTRDEKPVYISSKYIHESINRGDIFLGRVIKSCGQYTNSKYNDEVNELMNSQKYKNYIQMIRNASAKNREIEYENNNYIPIKVTKKGVTYNSIGIPETHISFKNLSDKTIDAFEVRIYPYDSYGRHVSNFVGESTFNGIVQNISIAPSYQASYTWTLNLFENTTNFEVEVVSVHFDDGSVWN